MPQRRPQTLAGSGLHPLGKCNKTRLYPGKGAGRSDEVGTWAGAVPVPRSMAFGARSACRQSRAFLRVGTSGVETDAVVGASALEIESQKVHESANDLTRERGLLLRDGAFCRHADRCNPSCHT